MYRKILIVKLSAIGDVIHALPVAAALKAQFPQAKITWLVEKAAYDLLANHPYIDEVILFDKPRFKSWSGLLRYGPSYIKDLRGKHFDLVLDLQGLFKSGILAWASGSKQRFVYENAREGSQYLSTVVKGKHSQGHVVEQYLDVARHVGCVVQSVDFAICPDEIVQKQAKAIAAHAGLKMERPYVLLALGANWPNKIWPYQYFAALADMLYEQNVVPVMIGGPGDTLLAQQVLECTAIPPIDLTGKTTLLQLAAIMRHATAFVGGDTGPMHLAAAVGKTVVALFGPTDPRRNGPFGAQHHVLVADIACQGCWQRRCMQQPMIDCMAMITPQVVYRTLRPYLP